MARLDEREPYLPAGDLNHLYDIVKYHFEQQTQGSRAGNEALARMRALLDAAVADDGSIMPQDHWAFYFEATGKFGRAAAHRR